MIAYLEALRPKQWIKNGLVLIGVVFAGMLADPAALARAALGFAGFSLLSGAVYLFNDLRDVEADRLHPKKRLRPIPSGRLPLGAAWAWLVVVLLGAAAIAWALGPWYAATAGTYLVLNLAYSLGLKHVVLVDVLTIATGFVLRAIAAAPTRTTSSHAHAAPTGRRPEGIGRRRFLGWRRSASTSRRSLKR